MSNVKLAAHAKDEQNKQSKGRKALMLALTVATRSRVPEPNSVPNWGLI
jgi:hypothetical protein